ncbi:Olfactory receptor 10J1 [Heterocephalus glaber]|uniref:Olfactory receptor 10J1 n=1 Tax=Heterocephalus glaber TaxID=10181 RepID=G5BWM5_HETGA|nr:Olfactory receptor 10J1 [Heterocephalus glaber]
MVPVDPSSMASGPAHTVIPHNLSTHEALEQVDEENEIMNNRESSKASSDLGLQDFDLLRVIGRGSYGKYYTNQDFMKKENHTLVSEFVFQGFSSFHEHQFTFFVVFLALYILTLAGNIMVTITGLDCYLRIPMYFFLSMLSASETVYTLVIIPRMLSNLIGLNQPISLAGCATQMFFITLAINNCFLLTAMGYDHFVAICNPLRYKVIMNKSVCIQLVWGACSTGLIVAVIQVSAVFRVPFYATEVAHFFCDIRPVVKLSCIDTTVNEIQTLIISVLMILIPMGLIFISYIRIISTILRIASAEARKKAFATCASHMMVVSVHYGCASIAYLKPKSRTPEMRTS